MKTFINKKTEITQAATATATEKTIMGYANLAIVGLNTAPQGGWTPAEMSERLKVIAKLDAAELDAEVLLEDAEFNLLVACSNIKWQFMHKDVVAFAEYLEEVKKQND